MSERGDGACRKEFHTLCNNLIAPAHRRYMKRMVHLKMLGAGVIQLRVIQRYRSTGMTRTPQGCTSLWLYIEASPIESSAEIIHFFVTFVLSSSLVSYVYDDRSSTSQILQDD